MFARRTFLRKLLGLIGGAEFGNARATNTVLSKGATTNLKIIEQKNNSQGLLAIKSKKDNTIDNNGAFFSSDNVPGTYNAATHTWIPGRGADGRITNASFELVPVGPWVVIADTGFVSHIQPLLNAALPKYKDIGTGGLRMVLDAYSGVALDVEGGRMFVHGGGHHDSANNGIYLLDFAKMAWSIAKLPDIQNNWPSNYSTSGTGSFTNYPPALDYVSANPNTTDVFSDEFFDLTNTLANTRNPTARHTYEGMTFYDGKLRHSVRRYWEWDEVTGVWSKQFPFNKSAVQHKKPGGGYMGENMKSTYDEVTSRFISTPTFTAAPGAGWAYNTESRAWTQPQGLLGGWRAYQSGFARRGREWCSFAPPRAGDTSYWPPTLRAWNLDTGTALSTTLTGMVHSQCVGSQFFGETTTMCYIDATGKFAALFPYYLSNVDSSNAAAPLVIGMIDTTAATIEIEIQTGAWPVLKSLSPSVNNRFNYIRQMRCLILIQDGSKNIIIRKFG